MLPGNGLVDPVPRGRLEQVARVTTTPPHHRVAAGILIRHDRVLLCHRRADLAWYPGVWDLVGGHVEAGESARQALARECREELAVDIGVPRLVTRLAGEGLDLTVFLVSSWAGEPVNAAPVEHQDIGWVTASQIPDLALAHPRLAPLLREILDET
jgi:8-oxo-dGTP diphosphatase